MIGLLFINEFNEFSQLGGLVIESKTQIELRLQLNSCWFAVQASIRD
jgi:hypothetical protein